MDKKLQYLGTFTLIVVISFSLTSAFAAEKKKKSVTALAQKNRWEQEPTSFMGIELDQPLSKSVSSECPKDSYGDVDEPAADSLGKLCHNDFILKRSGSYSSKSLYIKPFLSLILFFKSMIYLYSCSYFQ